MRVVVSSSRLFLKNRTKTLLPSRLAIVLTCVSTGLLPGAEGAAYADTRVVTGTLRGSSVEKSSIPSDVSGLALRGSSDATPAIDELELADPVVEDSSPDNAGFMHDLIAASSYIRRSFVPVVFSRDASPAVLDRESLPDIPDRPLLRQSMMHSKNVYEGFRGASGEIGETIRFALRGSYSSRARLEKSKSDRARVHGALAGYLPKLMGSANSSFTSEDGATSTKDQAGRVTLGIEVSMPLYTSGVNLNTYRQARQLSLASDYSFLAEEHRVALEAIASHINLRLNRRIERTLSENVKATQRIAHIAQKLFEAGDSSRTDVAIATANVESARAELDLARKSREETLSDYESLTGKSAPAVLLQSNYQGLIPDSVDEAVEMAVTRNPTLIASRHTALAGTYAARIERGRFGPQFDLYGKYDQDVYRSAGNDKISDWTVGVRLRVPLFDATFAPTVNAARHDALESEYRAMDQSRLIVRQVNRQWSAYHSAARRVGIVRRQVRAVAASVEGARREYEAGFRSITDVLNDQLKLARAKITLESASHEKMLAAYELAITTAHPAVRELVHSQ